MAQQHTRFPLSTAPPWAAGIGLRRKPPPRPRSFASGRGSSWRCAMSNARTVLSRGRPRSISNSLSDNQPVFETIVRSGVTLFSEAAVSSALVEHDMVRAAAVADRAPARAEAWRRIFPFPLTREYMHSKVILERKMLDIPDAEHAPADLAVGAKNFLRSGYRAVTVVPLMRGDQAIGALSVVRVHQGPISEKKLATHKTYADHAIIA